MSRTLVDGIVASSSLIHRRPNRAHTGRRSRKPSSVRARAAADESQATGVPGQSSLGRSHSYPDDGDDGFDALEPYRTYFPSSYEYDVKMRAVAPARYRVTLPKGYDGKRGKPYPAVVCVPGDTGFGPREGKVSMTTGATKKKWHDKNEAIIVECAFNSPTWLNDSASVNHESYFLRVMLPHFLASHNVGKLALLGYGTGALGVLSMMMRRPTAFDCVVAADVPILGGYKTIEREWGSEDLKRGASWGSWNEAFPKDEDWHAYDVTRIVRDEWVQAQLNESGPRIALLPGNKTAHELGDFIAQLDTVGVAHDVLPGFEGEEIDRQGAWIEPALDWIASRLA